VARLNSLWAKVLVRVVRPPQQRREEALLLLPVAPRRNMDSAADRLGQVQLLAPLRILVRPLMRTMRSASRWECTQIGLRYV
jgi:hypothetical protein